MNNVVNVCIKVLILAFIMEVIFIENCIAMDAIKSPIEMPPRESPELLSDKIEFRAPTAMAFDSKNRPYMINTRDPDSYGSIMTLKGNEWIAVSYLDALRQAVPNIELPPERHWFANGMLTFDDSDALYAVIPVWRKFPSAKDKEKSGVRRAGSVLLYSTDLGKTFKVYRIDALQAMEAYVGHNDFSSPPLLVLMKHRKNYSTRWAAYHTLSVLIPTKKGNELEFGEPVFITDDCAGMTIHSGGYSFSATRGRRSHIVYTEIPKEPGSDVGNPTYIATIDRQKRTVLARKKIAIAHPKYVDGHSTPVVAFDNKGYLHVICGAHNGPFQYTRSLQPDDISGWLKPADIWAAQTYATLIIDHKSRLHSVFREKQQLMHIGKEIDSETWDKPISIAKKPRNYGGYTVFYHHLFLDRIGTLYLSFTFYEHISGKEWLTPTVLTYSTDGGKTWYLAKKEFLKNQIVSK